MYFNRKNAEQKNWRMIKKGKHFLFGCSLVFAVGATLATPTVHADTAEAKAEVTTSTTQVEPTAEAPTYAAPAATSPVATETVEANSATTAVSVDKSQLEAVLAQAKAKNLDAQEASVKAEVTAAIAEAEALVANGSASQEQVNQSVERLTQAVASVKEVTEATVETTTEAASEETTDSSETPKVRNKRATSEGSVRSVDENNLQRAVVTKENFESFFQEGGTASYDESTGTIRLTEDARDQAGNAYLRFKIDSNEDFTFTGKIDIGNKYEGHPVDGRVGGDGVGFVFHTGNVDKLGQNGASVGMGTIKNAFGFKLDSYHNTSNPAAKDNSIKDPRYGDINNAFGAFYSSNAGGKVDNISDAKALTPAPNGQWVDFKIEYKGDSKQFTVTYGNQTWSTNITRTNGKISPNARTELSKSNALYALSFAASTGGATNLQRVQIERFEFTAPQIVHVKYVDEQGNELATNTAVPGDENQVVNLNNINSLQKTINALKAKGYTLKDVNKDKAETYNAATNTVTLRKGGQLLKYVFAPDIKEPALTPVNNITNLTADEKTKVKAAIKAANPKATTVVVGNDGSATVTFQDGTTAPLTGAQTVKAADANGIKAPTTKTPVKNLTALTTAEKQAVEAAIKAANPKATTVVVGNDGSATVTFPDGTTATLPGAKTVKEADSKGVQDPAAKTPVQNTSALTQPEKDAVKKAVETANPTATKVEVGNDGSATVTFPDGTTATLPGDKTVKEADSKGVQEPAAKTPVQNTSALTQPEKDAVKKAVEDANPTATKVEVGNDGSATVTFPDGSTATLTGDKTVYTSERGELPDSFDLPKLIITKWVDEDGNELKSADAKAPAELGESNEAFEHGEIDGYVFVRTLTDESDGNVTHVFRKLQDTKAPATPVVNPVKAGDTAVTGTAEAGSTVEVTLPDGTKVSAKADKDGKFSISVDGLNEGDKVSVTATDAAGNKSGATDATVAKADDKTAPTAPVVNPVKAGDKAITGTAEAGSTVEVTLPDGTKATATADQDGNFSVPVSGLEEGKTVSVTATDVAGNKSTPTSVTVPDTTAPTAPVVNPVKAGDTAITGTAEAGSTVEVTLPDGTKVSAKADKDGKFSIPVSSLNAGDTVSVTTTDEAGNTSATTTVTVSKVNVGGKDADNAKVPVLTPVVDPNNLTDAEKAKVAEEVKKANPTATDVKVNNDGSVVVTFADGSVATIAANKVVKEATKESPAQAPAKKAGAKELPNTGTKQSNASLGLALLAAVTGGLLISKKRKEEE